MERLTTLHHRGAEIVVIDYSGLRDPQDSLALVRASADRLVQAPPGSARVLMAVGGLTVAPELFTALRDGIGRGRPHVKALAVVGLSGLLKAMFPMVRQALDVEMPLFDSRAEALDWLAGLP